MTMLGIIYTKLHLLTSNLEGLFMTLHVSILPNIIEWQEEKQYLLNTTRHLSFNGRVPKKCWGKVVFIVLYVINRIPSHILKNKSPLEIIKLFFPHFKISNGHIPRKFGCKTFVYIHNQNRDKHDTQAIRCVFIGYSTTQKGNKCYSPSFKKCKSSLKHLH